MEPQPLLHGLHAWIIGFACEDSDVELNLLCISGAFRLHKPTDELAQTLGVAYHERLHKTCGFPSKTAEANTIDRYR